MKSRVCSPPLAVSFQSGHRSPAIFSAGHRLDGTRARRQRRLLLGVSILLILGWTLGAIWLISVRQEERSTTEALARQGAIAAFFSGEMGRTR